MIFFIFPSDDYIISHIEKHIRKVLGLEESPNPPITFK